MSKAKKALIFQGGWGGHTPKEVADQIKDMLEKESFEVDLYDHLDCLADGEALKKYDLIVPLWTMGEIKGEYVNNVCAAVEAGTGLAGCHGGMCDAFRNNTEWQFMTGSQFISHPGGDGTEYTVNFVGDSIFSEGLSDFKIASEQYYIHYDPSVKIYATTKVVIMDGPHGSGVDEIIMPVIYTKMWGKGKVFYTCLGHNYHVFDDCMEARETMRRGLVWAAKEE